VSTPTVSPGRIQSVQRTDLQKETEMPGVGTGDRDKDCPEVDDDK